jgi:hypothetical protein
MLHDIIQFGINLSVQLRVPPYRNDEISETELAWKNSDWETTCMTTAIVWSWTNNEVPLIATSSFSELIEDTVDRCKMEREREINLHIHEALTITIFGEGWKEFIRVICWEEADRAKLEERKEKWGSKKSKRKSKKREKEKKY